MNSASQFQQKASVYRRLDCVYLLLLTVAVVLLPHSVSHAQLAPEIGYMLPAGGSAGETTDVILGGFDWTPDMQLFVHDPRIKLELLGPPGPVLVPEPPYWFGAKARGYAWPLAREFKARLTIPAGFPAGLVKWQVANANGVSPVAQFFVGRGNEVREIPDSPIPQKIERIPVTISGQIRRIEEIDRYQFQVDRTGPVTIEVVSRRIASPLHAMVQVSNSRGERVLDVGDSEGRDQTISFTAHVGEVYTLSLHDLDFAGDRSYVYRLLISPGPQILSAYPSAGTRGATQKIEFLGYGIATGNHQLESVVRDVAIPNDPTATQFEFRLPTPAGESHPFVLGISGIKELAEAIGGRETTLTELPTAITGSIESRYGSDRYQVTLKQGETWRIIAQARSPHRKLDLELAVVGADGKDLARVDDAAGTTDAELNFSPPAAGVYTIVVSDRSGKSGTRESNYRLVIEPLAADFVVTVPPMGVIPLGGELKLPLRVQRIGGMATPITLALTGLPEGVVLTGDLTIPADKAETTLTLTAPANSPVTAQLANVTATGTVGAQSVSKLVGQAVLAVTMKPRIKLTPEGLDDVRKVHRGSTFLAPLLIERFEGFAGDITLEMTAKQQRHRQGLASDEMVVPPQAQRVEYPIFVPEWLETTKTSRMIVNGAVRVPDPRGTVRTLLQRQELRIGILPEGALMKLAHSAGEPEGSPGSEITVPISLSRAPGFVDEVKVELVGLVGKNAAEPIAFPEIAADPLTLTGNQTTSQLKVRISETARIATDLTFRLRATALQQGKWKVVSETDLLIVPKS